MASPVPVLLERILGLSDYCEYLSQGPKKGESDNCVMCNDLRVTTNSLLSQTSFWSLLQCSAFVDRLLCEFNSSVSSLGSAGCPAGLPGQTFVSLVIILAELPEEKEKVKKAADHCRQILNHVNQAVKESENKQVGGAEGTCRAGGSSEPALWGVFLLQVTLSLRFLQHLEDYQRRLDLSYLKQSEDPMMDEFRVSGSIKTSPVWTEFAALSFTFCFFFWCTIKCSLEINISVWKWKQLVSAMWVLPPSWRFLWLQQPSSAHRGADGACQLCATNLYGLQAQALYPRRDIWWIMRLFWIFISCWVHVFVMLLELERPWRALRCNSGIGFKRSL